MTPAEARAGARGKRVHYAVRDCSLGTLLVAWTERGVCEVCFEDDERAAVAGLRARFPGASCTRSATPPWVDELLAAVEQPRALEVPLDIRGTAFQQRVWSELQRIPLGETRSYAEIARAIGAPQAVRAVAGACARNRVAVLVPCHRVVRADGALSGYRWGRARKQELLRREQAR
jgi:AraC family transcriptional regulator of adaptative response/methylated-DNA-[protein]-cysteine methyltransferase